MARLSTIQFTILLFLSLSGCERPVFSQNSKALEQADAGEWFGIRLRTVPDNTADIHEPVWVAEAPGNESTIIQAADGSLRVFFINRPGEGDKLMSVASVDGGKTWGDPAPELDLPGTAYYANRVIAGKADELHAVLHIFEPGDNGYRGRHYNLWYCRFDKTLQEWGTPQKIFDGYVGAIRSFVQLKNGRLLASFARAVPERTSKPVAGEVDYGWNDIISVYSDDGGATWEQSETSLRVAVDSERITRYGAIEPVVIELADGRLWMLIRTNKGRLYESWSHNGGTSWQDPEPSGFVSSDSPADLLRLSDGGIVLFFVCNQRWDNPNTYALGGRDALHAAISRDEGKTWSGFREVLTIPSVENKAASGDKGIAYTSSAETSDGKIAVVSGQGEAKSIVLFDPDWLEQQEASDDFSNGLVQWTLHGVDSLIGLTKADGHALHFRRSGGHQWKNAEAVWNFPASSQGELAMDVEVKPGSKGISIALTDYFSLAADSMASANGVLQFVLNADDNIIDFNNGTRVTIRLKWDGVQQKATLYVGKEPVMEKGFSRIPLFGVNYLRVGIPGGGRDRTGFILHSLRMVGADAKRKVVAFGNSTTAPRKGVAKVYPVRLEEMLTAGGIPVQVINAGKPGSHTGSIDDHSLHKVPHALDRLDTAVLRHRPALVVICFGMNDAWVDSDVPSPSRIPLDAYRRNLSAIIDAVQEQQAKVVLMTPNPIGRKYEQWRSERLEQYVAIVKILADERTLPLADTWTLFHEKSKALPEGIDSLLLDGMHPNDEGQAIMATVLSEIIKSRNLIYKNNFNSTR